MKGFLSLLGITLIVAAFGLILLSYSDIPLEELKSQERMNVYMETRQNHAMKNPNLDFLADSADSCSIPVTAQKNADSE
jgi:hypothetical protein